jgi:PAS domain S-box-containing protein
MRAVTRVDLHCHSTFSDGTLPPDVLAERLAAAGVVFASLTDHDTLDGLDGFRPAAARLGMGVIAGLELTVFHDGREAHLLAYGFDPSHPELLATLRSLQQARAPGVHSIANSIRKIGSVPPNDAGGEPAASVAPHGRLDIVDAIALVHRAGGLAFLAHPLVLEPDMERLRALASRLKEQGLDGIEALYGQFSDPQRSQLCALAAELGLLVSAGSDQHEPRPASRGGPGIDMPTDLWKPLRDALCSRASGTGERVEPPRAQPSRPQWRQFVFHIAFPSLLAIALFVAAIYAVFLPTLERSLMDRKREMIRELTSSAWSLLAEANRQEQTGLLTRQQAQDLAKSRIASLRYGREGKDYFWVQDMHPRMVMHPYRTDLNGQDVSDFRDPRGNRIFVEMADLVRRRSEGYIEYVWQWKDDPLRMVAKESYIRGFEPWGWIIGTGIYVDDVNQEIARIESNLVRASLVIAGIVALLLLYVIKESLRLERDRSRADQARHELTERYRSLVEASTEGTLLVLDDRCRYGNPVLLEMLGYSQAELEMHDLSDLMPRQEANQAAWDGVERLLAGREPPGGFEAALRRRDGSTVECVLALSRIAFAGRSGFILLAKEVGLRPGTAAVDESRLQKLASLAEAARVGLFRARAARRGVIVEANRAAGELLQPLTAVSGNSPSLADLFDDASDYEEFLRQLQQDGAAERQVHLSAADARARALHLRATLVRDEHGEPRFIDGTIEDVSAAARRETERESLIEKLQTSLLFLHEPLDRVGRSVVSCRLDTPVHRAAAMMTDQGSSAVLVQSETGDPLGIVTDHDLRERVLAAGGDSHQPVHRIMSAPLVAIPERSQVYEAMLTMQEKGVQHLVLQDDAGRIVGIIRSRELLQFPSHGALALVREIAHAIEPEEVARCCSRTPGLVKSLLDCGAHPRNITRMVASVWDAATERFVALAIGELGPAPAGFAFLVLGSQGRQEQTLFSDQDNAILYSLPDGVGESPEVSRYFNELGSRVCGWLNKAGLPMCRGNVMAQNPKWCQPLSTWKQYFAGWIERAEPQELLEFSIFFDFRAICGDVALARELRRYVHETLRSGQAFFPHFAQNSLLFKPPMRLFGRILGGAAAGEHPGSLNLKDAMMPIVNFARLYALRHEIDETHTLDRLDALAGQDVLLPSSREEITAAYDFLMRLRLRHQSAAIAAGQQPDNLVNHRKLRHMEEILLKQAFAQIDAVQKKISCDFLGGT